MRRERLALQIVLDEWRAEVEQQQHEQQMAEAAERQMEEQLQLSESELGEFGWLLGS